MRKVGKFWQHMERWFFHPTPWGFPLNNGPSKCAFGGCARHGGPERMT